MACSTSTSAAAPGFGALAGQCAKLPVGASSGPIKQVDARGVRAWRGAIGDSLPESLVTTFFIGCCHIGAFALKRSVDLTINEEKHPPVEKAKHRAAQHDECKASKDG